MKEFKSSSMFVSNVMENVRALERARELGFARSQQFLASRPARLALSTGGVVLGLVNLVRMCLTLFSPVLCR